MREIKFRWYSQGKFYYWGFIKENDETVFYAPASMYHGQSMTAKQVGEESEQYTGLLDKNGTEIYEGDIVTFAGNEYIAEPNDCCTVEFLGGGFMIKNRPENFKGILGMVYDELIIIGNIHENPELLEVV